MISLFEKSNCENGSPNAGAFFYTFHLMVTIETDDQTGLVATIAVSVSK